MPSIDKNATDQGVKFSSSNQFMPMAKKDKKIFSRSQKSHHLQDPEAELPMLPGNGNQVMFTSSFWLFISNDVWFIVTFSLLHVWWILFDQQAPACEEAPDICAVILTMVVVHIIAQTMSVKSI